jgi:hypothetical protein
MRPYPRPIAAILAVVATLAALLLAVPPASGAPGPTPASVGGPAPLATPAASAADLCARVGSAAGFPRPAALTTAVAIALAESGCQPGARGSNGPTAGCPNGSLDRGLWQINDCYHYEVSDSCAYDAQCNANAAARISARGRDFTPWSTYNSGAYRAHLDAARAAVARLGLPATGIVQTGGPPLTVRSRPTSGSTAVGSVAAGSTITIRCQVRGETISGPWGPTDLWDRIGSGRYVTDAYVFTGSNGRIAPLC